MDDTKTTTITVSVDEERRLRFSRERNAEIERVNVAQHQIDLQRKQQDFRERAEAEKAEIQRQTDYWVQQVKVARHSEADALQRYEHSKAERERREHLLASYVEQGGQVKMEEPTAEQLRQRRETEEKERKAHEEEHQHSLAKHTEPENLGRMQREYEAQAAAEKLRIEQETTFVCHCGARLKNGTKVHKKDEHHYCLPSDDPLVYLQLGYVPTLECAQELHSLDGSIQYVKDLNESLTSISDLKINDYSGVHSPNPVLQGQ